MDNVNRGSLPLLFWVFLLSGPQVQCQSSDVYMYCPAEDWIQGSTITFQCFVLRSEFPSKCVTNFVDQIQFRTTPSGAGYSENCTLSSATGTCTSSSNACSCQTGNATYYKFEFTFTAHSDYDGYWDCRVPCFNGLIVQLSYSSDNCDNRTVIAPTTVSPTTTTQATGTSFTSPADTTDVPHTTTDASSSGVTTSEPSPSTGSSDSSKTSSNVTDVTGTSTPPSAATSGTTGSVAGHADSVSDPALFVGVGFAGLVCLVGIVVVIVLTFRQREKKSRKYTTGENHFPPDRG